MNRVVVMEMAGSSEEATKHRQETISVDLNSSVANFRTLVGDAFAKEPNNIQLIHLGNTLKDSDSLESAGVNADAVVLLYPSKQETPISSSSTEALKNKAKIVFCVEELLRRNALQLIVRPELQMHLLRSMPQLECSTIGLLLSAPVFKNWLEDKKQDFLDKAASDHPLLGQALEVALQYVLTRGDSVVPKTSGNAYSVDTVSDDDSEDDMDVQGNQQRQGGARAQSGPRNNGQRPVRGAITNEMLQAALQTAYSEQTQVAARNFGPQLAAMREMGLCDERVCIQALVRTGGDVDMAVDLLLSE